MNRLALVFAAGLGGALIVVACSDDSPTRADAATCDCPAAESPITAARLHRVDQAGTIAASNDTATLVADCPQGELLVAGSCYIDVDNTAHDVFLTGAGQVPADAAAPATSWACHWVNKSTTGTANIRAQAVCLKPAP